MKYRFMLLAAVVCCVGAFIGAPSASAAPPSTQGTGFTDIPVRGLAGTTAFVGTLDIERFGAWRGRTFAIGTLTGNLGPAPVTREVRIPVRRNLGSGASTKATCEILTLVLGPLDLNLLGLRVQLNRINLRITAVEGPGNLLGNLLCAVAGLLDRPTLGAQALSQLLNVLQAVLANQGVLRF